MQYTKLLATLGLSLAAAGFAGTAVAATPAAEARVSVRYGDLNIASTHGIAKLQARIRMAAKQVCEPLQSRVLSQRHNYDSCVSDAIAGTRNQVPALTASRS